METDLWMSLCGYYQKGLTKNEKTHSRGRLCAFHGLKKMKTSWTSSRIPLCFYSLNPCHHAFPSMIFKIRAKINLPFFSGFVRYYVKVTRKVTNRGWSHFPCFYRNSWSSGLGTSIMGGKPFFYLVLIRKYLKLGVMARAFNSSNQEANSESSKPAMSTW